MQTHIQWPRFSSRYIPVRLETSPQLSFNTSLRCNNWSSTINYNTNRDSQTTRSKPAMVACVYFIFVLDIVISIENYIQKQNKYSHKVNKRVDQPIIQNLMYIRRRPFLHSLKYWSKYSFSVCAFSHSPSVEKQEYLKGRYNLSLKEIFKSKIEPWICQLKSC